MGSRVRDAVAERRSSAGRRAAKEQSHRVRAEQCPRNRHSQADRSLALSPTTVPSAGLPACCLSAQSTRLAADAAELS